MNIAIVEDDAADREHLLDCLANYAVDTKTAVSVSTFGSSEAFFADNSMARYGVIFLDIYLGDDTGMELAKRLRETHINSQIVFVTVSETHAVASYQVGATYYLLKPYQYSQFLDMMQAVAKWADADEQAIAVKVGRDMERIPLSAIVYADYADHYVHLHTASRDFRTYAGFQEIADQLLEDPRFLQCYRNTVINMDKIQRQTASHFVLAGEVSIPITRNRVREMREAYAAYIFDRMKRGERP